MGGELGRGGDGGGGVGGGDIGGIDSGCGDDGGDDGNSGDGGGGDGGGRGDGGMHQHVLSWRSAVESVPIAALKRSTVEWRSVLTEESNVEYLNDVE